MHVNYCLAIYVGCNVFSCGTIHSLSVRVVGGSLPLGKDQEVALGGVQGPPPSQAEGIISFRS